MKITVRKNIKKELINSKLNMNKRRKHSKSLRNKKKRRDQAILEVDMVEVDVVVHMAGEMAVGVEDVDVVVVDTRLESRMNLMALTVKKKGTQDQVSQRSRSRRLKTWRSMKTTTLQLGIEQ
jgi:hypothetical protein